MWAFNLLVKKEEEEEDFKKDNWVLKPQSSCDKSQYLQQNPINSWSILPLKDNGSAVHFHYSSSSVPCWDYYPPFYNLVVMIY